MKLIGKDNPTVSWLSRYHELDSEYKRLLKDLFQTNDQIENLTGKLSFQPRAPQPAVSGLVEKLMDIASETEEALDKTEKAKKEIRSAIDHVGDSEYREILRSIYIDRMNPIVIAKVMNCARTTIHRKHDKAIELVEKVIEK